MEKDDTLPEGLTPQARRKQAEFMRKYERLVAKQKSEEALTILVWGPNPGKKTKVAAKRLEIVQQLNAAGHFAMISEKLPLVDPDVSLKSHEYSQAQLADLVIVLLGGSLGALGEVHDFCSDEKLVSKFFVLAPVSYESGYSRLGVLKILDEGWGGVYWYQLAELQQCSVSHRALKRAAARRELRRWNRKGRT